MGQAMQKLTGAITKGAADPKQQQNELRKIVESYINEHYDEFETNIKDRSWDGFYHMVYEIVEKLTEKSGAMQFKLPPIEKLKAVFNEVHPKTNQRLTADEFRKIIERVVSLDSFYVGQGAKDIFLYIFGVPVLSLLAKRILPGPTRAISDDVFIPLATTGTVVYLAKTNKL